MDPDKLVGLLKDHDLWVVFGVAFAFGAIGALIHRWSVPPPSSSMSEPPVLGADILTGAIAAVAILYVTKPETGVTLVCGALVAGYSAKTIMAGLEARAASVVAQRDASDSKRQADAAKYNLASLAERVSLLPEPAAPAPLDRNPITDAKQLARQLKAQLGPPAME
jgi:hypothetical protein